MSHAIATKIDKPEDLERLVERLTPQMIRFCEEYIIDLNQARAYRAAGGQSKNISAACSNLMNNVFVNRYIEHLMATRSEATGVTATMVVRELATIAFSNLDFVEIDDDGFVTLSEDAPAEAMRAIQAIKRRVRYDEDGNKTVETEVKFWNKNDALKVLAQHLGILYDGPSSISQTNIQQKMVFGGHEINF